MYVIFGCVIISSVFLTVSAIQCYYCESVYDPMCGYNFDSEEYFKIDCDVMAPPRYIENELASPNATACMKRVYREHSVTKYVRSCYFGNITDTEIGCRLDPALAAVKNETCFVCNDEDFCNKAPWNHNDHWSCLLSLISLVFTARIFNLQCL